MVSTKLIINGPEHISNFLCGLIKSFANKTTKRRLHASLQENQFQSNEFEAANSDVVFTNEASTLAQG